MARCGNVAEFRDAARRRIPSPIFHYIDGGADDERTLLRNVNAFTRLRLRPRALVDVSDVKLASRLFGRDTAFPLMLAPTGMSRLFNIGKELAAARAAANAGVFYGLSTLATTSLEDIGAATAGPKIFQVYVFKDRGLTRELVARTRAAGYDALCLTVDTPVAGNRERDRRTGMTMPPRFGPRTLWQFARRPGWALDLLRSPDFGLANVAHRADASRPGALGHISFVNDNMDRSVTWVDAAWLAKEWGGPIAMKGIITVEDAVRARDIGASAIMISNHGGRQLDDVAAPVDMVGPIREAVGSEIELIVDGGIRRGSDIFKALCLGADACSIGRAYLYGLAAAGQKGVAAVIDILCTELERTMILAGCTNLASLGPSLIERSVSELT